MAGTSTNRGEAHLQEREHDSNDGLEFKPNFRRRSLSGGDEMSEFSLLQKVAVGQKKAWFVSENEGPGVCQARNCV